MNTQPRNTRGMVRFVEGAAASSPARRGFFRTLAHGAALPVACALGNSASVFSAPRVLHHFESPQLELIRLLREACTVEHALMLQYLYAAFSIKPAYSGLVGSGAPGTHDLIGVAVQEMQHLGAVNGLLVSLGAAPNLVSVEFPLAPDIYPFELNLEPLTRDSLAKYVY